LLTNGTITERRETLKQLETDVVVVGGGTCGMTAAVAAAEGGASVIVLEKASTTGGTGNMGMGILAIGSRQQRERQIKFTTEEAFKIFMDFTHWRVDSRLVRAFLDKSSSTADWLEGMGVNFLVDPNASASSLLIIGENGRPGPGSNAAMMKRVTERAQKLGVKILLRTPAKKIIKEGGRITGVMAEDQSGETIQAKAKVVIIGTGGFGDNPEWIKKYTGYEWGRNILSMRIPGLVGDGIRMAWEAGAAPTEMNMQVIYGGGDPDLEPDIGLAFSQPNLTVNLLGHRFINEDEVMINRVFAGNAVAKQKNGCAFTIFDSAIKKHYEEKGIDFPSYLMPGKTTIAALDAMLKQAIEKGNKHLFIVDSLEELAQKTGINPASLQKTVDEYNKFCEAGHDELFNKDPKFLRPIKQPKFYARTLIAGAYGSLGGIKINYKMEVLTKDYDVIPGFFAAGTDVNTLYADSYIMLLPGNTMGFAVNSGRMAGESAAAYIKSIAK
jgi:fumarate reductase flavoprotein subunit